MRRRLLAVIAAAALMCPPPVFSQALSGAGSALTLVSTQGGAAAAYTWTGLTGDDYDLRCNSVIGATSTASAGPSVYVQFGTGPTPTFDTASNYTWLELTTSIVPPGTSPTAPTAFGQNDIGLIVGATTTNDYGASFSMELHGLASSTAFKMPAWTSNQSHPTGAQFISSAFNGRYFGSQAPITGIRVIANADTIASGDCSLWRRAP